MKKQKRKSFNSNTFGSKLKRINYDDVIKPLFRLFIEPLLLAWTPGPEESRVEIMHNLMGISERPIYCVRVKEAFSMPGQIRDADTDQFVVPTVEQRDMRKGHQLWVRFDSKNPARVEVEVDHSDLVFYLNQYQWNDIKRKCLHVG